MLKVPMEKRPIWQRILYCLILALALGNVSQFFVLACYRLFYPFELEWIEGAFVDQARWLMEGRPLYAEPSIYMIPGPYTPLFFLTSALLMKVLGVGFVAPRLISFLSTLGCLLSLFWIVARGTGCKSCGLVAAGIYAATFRFAGAWMDLAKTDSLFLCLVLAAFCVGHQYPNRWGMVISGLLYTLAYYTKQSALLIVVVLAPLSLLVSRGRTWIQWLSTAISGFVAFAWLDIVSDGWFSFYTLHHTMVSDIWSGILSFNPCGLLCC